jgi:hypothetical protein
MLFYNSRRTGPAYSLAGQNEEGTNDYPPLGLENNDPVKLRDAAYKPIALLSIERTQVLHRPFILTLIPVNRGTLLCVQA